MADFLTALGGMTSRIYGGSDETSLVSGLLLYDSSDFGFASPFDNFSGYSPSPSNPFGGAFYNFFAGFGRSSSFPSFFGGNPVDTYRQMVEASWRTPPAGGISMTSGNEGSAGPSAPSAPSAPPPDTNVNANTPTQESTPARTIPEEARTQAVTKLQEMGYGEAEAREIIAKIVNKADGDTSRFSAIFGEVPPKTTGSNGAAPTENTNWAEQFGKWYAQYILGLSSETAEDYVHGNSDIFESQYARNSFTALVNPNGVERDSTNNVYDVYHVTSREGTAPRGAPDNYYLRDGKWHTKNSRGRYQQIRPQPSLRNGRLTFGGVSYRIKPAVTRMDARDYMQILDRGAETIRTRENTQRQTEDGQRLARANNVKAQLERIEPRLQFNVADSGRKLEINCPGFCNITADQWNAPTKARIDTALAELPAGTRVSFKGEAITPPNYAEQILRLSNQSTVGAPASGGAQSAAPSPPVAQPPPADAAHAAATAPAPDSLSTEEPDKLVPEERAFLRNLHARFAGNIGHQNLIYAHGSGYSGLVLAYQSRPNTRVGLDQLRFRNFVNGISDKTFLASVKDFYTANSQIRPSLAPQWAIEIIDGKIREIDRMARAAEAAAQASRARADRERTRAEAARAARPPAPPIAPPPVRPATPPTPAPVAAARPTPPPSPPASATAAPAPPPRPAGTVASSSATQVVTASDTNIINAGIPNQRIIRVEVHLGDLPSQLPSNLDQQVAAAISGEIALAVGGRQSPTIDIRVASSDAATVRRLDASRTNIETEILNLLKHHYPSLRHVHISFYQGNPTELMINDAVEKINPARTLHQPLEGQHTPDTGYFAQARGLLRDAQSKLEQARMERGIGHYSRAANLAIEAGKLADRSLDTKLIYNIAKAYRDVRNPQMVRARLESERSYLGHYLRLEPRGSHRSEASRRLSEIARHLEAMDHYQRGTAHINAERYEEAIREYKLANTLLPNPVTLLAIARAYDYWGDHPRDAIDYFGRYLHANPHAPDKQEIVGRVRALRELLQPSLPAAATVPPPPPARPVAPPPAPPASSPPSPPARTTASAAVAPPPHSAPPPRPAARVVAQPSLPAAARPAPAPVPAQPPARPAPTPAAPARAPVPATPPPPPSRSAQPPAPPVASATHSRTPPPPATVVAPPPPAPPAAAIARPATATAQTPPPPAVAAAPTTPPPTASAPPPSPVTPPPASAAPARSVPPLATASSSPAAHQPAPPPLGPLASLEPRRDGRGGRPDAHRVESPAPPATPPAPPRELTKDELLRSIKREVAQIYQDRILTRNSRANGKVEIRIRINQDGTVAVGRINRDGTVSGITIVPDDSIRSDFTLNYIRQLTTFIRGLHFPSDTVAVTTPVSILLEPGS